MIPVEYLKNKLGELADKFSAVTFMYAFDDSIQTHIVQITPEVEYYHNNALDNARIAVSLEFMQLFEDEAISFVSSDSTLAVSNPEMVFNGFAGVQEAVVVH